MSEPSKAREQSVNAKNQIIVALDVETAIEARQIIAELRGEVGAFKIGLQLFTAAGASFVREVVESGIKVFLDVKFHDIPNTVAKASVEVARLGVWMFNVHAGGGSEMLRKTVENVSEICAKENLEKPKIIGVTVLTSSNQDTLREIGVERKVENQVLELARLSVGCGLDGVVASPLEIEAIRECVAEKDFLIVTPGIRDSKLQTSNSKLENKSNLQSETIDDQKRVMTAKDAVRAGSDYLVIGRPILQAENRVAAARKILAEIETV
jgi:orotidine-5'-phosphate decarboxylase